MAIQLGALNQALRKAGVDEDLARQAAEEVAGYDNRLGGIERRLVELQADIERRLSQFERWFADLHAEMDRRFADLHFVELRGEMNALREHFGGRFRLLNWMLGGVYALLAAILLKLILH